MDGIVETKSRRLHDMEQLQVPYSTNNKNVQIMYPGTLYQMLVELIR